MSTERVGIVIEVEGYEKAKKIMENLQDSIDVLNNATSIKVNLDTSTASRNIDKLKSKSLSLGKVYDTITKSVLHMGSAMQSAGNALTKLSNPFRSLMRSTVLAAGFQAFNKVSEGFQSGFDRYDTIKQYNLVMDEYSTKAYDVTKSTEDLIRAVKGMPTGLDEIASLAQRFTLSLGDMEEGTQLAIATNNAFLASMATDTQRYQGMMQLQDLVNGKDLSSREWMSLGSSMGKAINEIGKEFGYTNENMGDFRAELYAGNIATKDFLEALKKVGTGTGTIAKVAENAKVTWNAVFSNIGNAFSRMMKGVLDVMDELAMERTGKSLPLVLADYLDRIDMVTERMQGWVRENKDRIFAFIDMFKSIDWREIGSSFVEGLEMVFGGLEWAMGKFGGKGLNAYAKLIPIASVLGKFLTIFGGLWKGSRHILGGFGTGVFAIVRALLGGFGAPSFLKNLRGLGKTAEAAGNVNKRLPNIKRLMAGLKKNLIGLGNFAISAAKVGIIVGGVVLAVKAVKTIVADLAEMSQIAHDIDGNTIADIITWVGAIGGAIAVLGGIWGKANLAGFADIESGVLAIGVIVTTILGFAWVDSKIIEGTLKNFKNAVDYVGNIVDTLDGLSKRKLDMTGINKIFGQLDTVFGKDMASYSVWTTSPADAAQYANVAKGLGEAIHAILGVVEDLEALANVSFDVDKATSNLEGIATAMSTMYNKIQEVFGATGGTGYWAKYSASGGVTAQKTNTSALMAQLFGDLSTVVGHLKQARETVNSMGQINIEGFQTKMDNIGKLVEIFEGFWGQLDAFFYTSANAGRAASNVQSMSDAIASLNTLVDGLNTLNEKLASMNIGSTSDPVAKIVRTFVKGGLIDNLQEMSQQINRLNPGGATKRLSNMSEMFEALQGMFDSITGVSGGEGIKQAVETIKTQVTEFKDELNALIEELQEIGSVNGQGTGSIDMEIKITGRVTGASKVVSDVKKETGKITSAVNSVPTYFNKKITVNFSAVITGVGGIAGQVASAARRIRDSVLYSSNGGVVKPVYLASGGSLWHTRGTDTVPAMLTPGEFVQRKKAVDTFGLDFMRRVNNLDVLGAMQSIQARIGKQSMGTVINNTYNNNAHVTQIINNPTQDFTFRRASRYVGAL